LEVDGDGMGDGDGEGECDGDGATVGTGDGVGTSDGDGTPEAISTSMQDTNSSSVYLHTQSHRSVAGPTGTFGKCTV